MTDQVISEMGRRIVEAARLAAAMHLEQARDGQSKDGNLTNHGLGEATGGAGFSRSTDGRQPLEDARDGRSQLAEREAA